MFKLISKDYYQLVAYVSAINTGFDQAGVSYSKVSIVEIGTMQVHRQVSQHSTKQNYT